MGFFDKIVDFFNSLFNKSVSKKIDTKPIDNREVVLPTPPKPKVEESLPENTISKEKDMGEVEDYYEEQEQKSVVIVDQFFEPRDLFEYLVESESYAIHYNFGENGKTAPLGVYYKYYNDWQGWRFLTQIAQERGIEFYPSACDSVGCVEMTKIVKSDFKDEMNDILMEFIINEYVNRLHLDYFPGKRSALSYFSITVNGGKYRSARILQKVLNKHGLNLKVDGLAGMKTYDSLLNSGLDDEYLNQQILLEVYNFYNRLVERNPAKYERYYNGWINRLKKLGLNLN